MTSLAISDNGRVLIPAALREQLGFKPGSRIYAEVKDGSLVLTSAAQRTAQRRAYFADLMKRLNVPDDVSLVDEFIAERRAEAARD
ncbi:AbrB/MazE/SpoVT family DNA-binding domain-containing protein [Ottowia sp.]|uniref:AbrB/MazE/SpoVT family DNA-binding domain-containing protein n=1 Tax=Ottowia sp. TaxID=1898956 RepID=UPI002BD250D9|nr:AbrB/MazE/SpoVT family DNA-binding domain-containing protein [Ottowia sp.]HOB67519.1 AbrB/MazE/SpoVT family DNA-binding domain-containing protein [Ottowia sp.]HPZ58222.1 AbrB/MazE/SpoVT family DNA-binding domain-containing protein [Ottowia sp.]HQD48208.1 AbrB/MazE/SpoVT family DNA-binding domain-containing protein [Ottowia sp.]